MQLILLPTNLFAQPRKRSSSQQCHKMSALAKRYDDSFMRNKSGIKSQPSWHRRSTWNTSFSFPPKNSFCNNLVSTDCISCLHFLRFMSNDHENKFQLSFNTLSKFDFVFSRHLSECTKYSGLGIFVDHKKVNL